MLMESYHYGLDLFMSSFGVCILPRPRSIPKRKSDPFQESKASCDNGLSEKREQPALRVERTYNKALSSKTIKNLSKMLPEVWKYSPTV